MKWYLHYTEGCTPKLMQFNTREELDKFMLCFYWKAKETKTIG